MAKIKNYTSAYEELQGILAQIQSEEISLDDLGKAVKRATELITYCKEKLRTTETEIEQLLN